jgi:Tol biopolymer transport system component
VLRPLTEGELGFAPVPPSWSRDGRDIAFGSLRDDEVRVWVVPSAGGTDEMLFPALAGGQDCATWAWSRPSRIAFTGPLDAGEDLWMVDNAESTGFVNLTQGRVFAPSFPRWAPDGSRIAFSGYARAEDGTVEGIPNQEGGTAPGTEIFVVDVSTFELTRLTYDPARDQSPVWSPDGNSLLIASDRDGDFDLWLIPLDDPGQARDLIDDAAEPHADEAPDWYWAPHR